MSNHHPEIQVLSIDNKSADLKKKFCWLLYGQGVNLAEHCKKGLLGHTSNQLPMYGLVSATNIWLDEATCEWYYLFIMDYKFRLSHNFHLAFKYAEGKTIYYSHAGVFIVVRNAERILISPVKIADVSSDTYNLIQGNYQKREYATCRNWQFAVAFYEGLNPAQKKHNQDVVSAYKSATLKKPALPKTEDANLFASKFTDDFSTITTQQCIDVMGRANIDYLSEHTFSIERYFGNVELMKADWKKACQLITALMEGDTVFFYKENDGTLRSAKGRMRNLDGSEGFKTERLRGAHQHVLTYFDLEVNNYRSINLYNILTQAEFDQELGKKGITWK